MNIINKNNRNFFLFPAIVLALLFTSCSNNDDDPIIELIKPTIENVEIGSGNNSIGIIGRDFHFDMDVVAGNLIESVQIIIQPKSSETYTHDWAFEIIWDEYKGIKNINVHKHFNIPEDAPEGTYDFIIIVNDQNGTQLEDISSSTLYHQENLPVNPQISFLNISKNDENGFFYSNGAFANPQEAQLIKGDSLKSQVAISGVKGDGIMYILLIKKSLDHRPETIDDIDFNKVIVYDVFEHENEGVVYSFSNVIVEFDPTTFEFTFVRSLPNFIIGTNIDNNTTEPNAINNDKVWENGTYYFGVVYTNTTHNMSTYSYIEFKINGF